MVLLRSIITKTRPDLVEDIKWNVRSYFLNGTDRIPLSLQNKENLVKLILHMDTGRPEDEKGKLVIPDDSGMLQWQSHIRSVLPLADLSDIEAKEAQLAGISSRWLKIQ